MQDKELDNLINDAANQHHPPYDDEAWSKMLVLLDKHLPEKKDRRRPVIFWLVFLLLGGGITLGILQPWNNHKEDERSLAALEKKSAAAGTKKGEDDPVVNNTVAGSTGSATGENTAVPVTTGGSSKNSTAVTAATPAAEKMQQPVTAGKKRPSFTRHTISEAGNVAAPQDELVKNNRPAIQQKGKSVVKVKQSVPAADDDIAVNSIKQSTPSAENNSGDPAETNSGNTAAKPVEESNAAEKTATTTKQKEQPAQNDTAIKKQPPLSTTATTRNTKKDRSFTSNFALSFSTGADMSFVDLKNPGKVKLFYGAGAAYNIGKHIRISSGFYVSKKVYYAEPYQYKFPNGAVYPHLTGIDADCKVYEIPVSVFYNFKQHNRHQFYAGTGISSFLMKTEDYKYLYKTPTGQSYSYTRSIADENKHYFSVITISGGYQYHFNKRISIAAEPYFKLPLGGVGAGKIKLNSSGVLISAFIKPFAKSK
ncbi:MAG: hypothetical protein U0V75_00435 [Ferruginibacter sp.]